MNKRLSLKIASRVDTLLSEQLGEGVNPQQMLDDALYARDVLLVCDAMPDRELNRLSRMFRQALLEADEAPQLRAPMGIGGMLSSIFGSEPDEEAPAPAQTHTQTTTPTQTQSPTSIARRWLGHSAPAAK